MTRAASILLGASLLAGCPGPSIDPIAPADYAATYVEVRDCRPSGDHDLHNVRVLADPVALAPYRDRMEPFPVGAILLKEEFDFGDVDCTGEIVRFTAMQRLADGSASDFIDWYWQELDAEYVVVEENEPLCAGCHMGCDAGYLGTCAEEP